MKINTVIFDIGGVLVGYNWDKYLMDMFNDRTKVDRIKNEGETVSSQISRAGIKTAIKKLYLI